MRNLVRGLGVGLAMGVVVVSFAAASGAALTVNGGTIQAIRIVGGPDAGGPVVGGPETAPSGSALPQPGESAEPSLIPDGPSLGPGTPDPGGDPPGDRSDLLQPCPSRADCVIYVTRAGDNLVSIVRFFDVAMNDTMALNPWLEEAPHLPVGVELRLPWPAWLPGRPDTVPPDPTPGEPSLAPEPTPSPSPAEEPTPSPSPAEEPSPIPPPTEEPTPTQDPSPTESPAPSTEPTADPSTGEAAVG